LKGTATDLTGVNAHLLREADGGKAVSWGLQYRTEEGVVLKLSATILIEACQSLKGGTADKFGERACEGGLGTEEIKAGERAADTVDDPDGCRLRLEGVEKTSDRVGMTIEAVTQGASG
jgi:hypothetical protein